MKFISLDICASTNLEARRLADEGETGPVWVRSDLQTGGRGRRGRSWVSSKGNLFCSGLYSQNGPPEKTALLSFVAALAVSDLVETYVPDAHISVKWPNDVLLSGQKCAGILLESGHSGQRSWVIIGIGVNLTSHPADTDYPTTNVLAHIPAADLDTPEPIMTGPDAALAILVSRFEHWRTILSSQGFGPIRSAWTARAHNIPGSVTVRLPKETFTGQALGLGENGELRVSLDDGTIRDVHAGDVFPASDTAMNKANE